MEEHLNWPTIFRWTFNIRIIHGNFFWTVSRFLRRWRADFLRDLSRMWYQRDGAPAHKSAQPCTFLAQTFDTRIIGYGGQEVAEATGGVSDAGLVLHFCGRQSF
ncbi:uncharacterized protein TNCV_1979111 [Trichonephila clavipes]|nr:uncharacterized protein TNCV_1979111 [Trichonephila clavipes]